MIIKIDLTDDNLRLLSETSIRYFRRGSYLIIRDKNVDEVIKQLLNLQIMFYIDQD